jgi:nucleotide-binding universal stress UspA family protein
MYSKILLAVDGSEHSRKALEAALEFARLSGAEVLLVHFQERDISKTGVYDLETQTEGMELVRTAEAMLEKAGVRTQAVMRPIMYGYAAQEILAEAGVFKPDLIVMGSRGLSDFIGLLLGSVAHKVMHFAPCPVLVVR